MSCFFKYIFNFNGKHTKPGGRRPALSFHPGTTIYIALFFAVSLPLFSDTVEMKDGRMLVGSVVGQNRASITLQTEAGRIQLPKLEIRRVKFGETQADLDRQKALEEKRREAARLADAKRRTEELKRIQEEEQNQKAQMEKRKSLVENIDNEAGALIREEEEIHKEEAALAEKRRKLQAKQAELALRLKGTEYEKKYASLIAMAERPTPLGALWRSALVPGWGQWKRDDRWRASFLAGGMVFAVGYTYSKNNARITALNDYHETSILGPLASSSLSSLTVPAYYLVLYRPALLARSDVASTTKAANSGLEVLGAIYLYNLFDAYFLHRSKMALARSEKGRGELFAFALPVPDRSGRAGVMAGLAFRF